MFPAPAVRPLSAAVAAYRRSPSTLGLHDLLRPFLAACYEVGRAHSRGVLHLALNPRYILVGEFGETRVAGWNGQATDAFAAAFLAPEQTGLSGDKIGPASDLYALGAILYFLLTGQPLYCGATAAEVRTRVREGLAWQPRMVARGVPAGLEAICLTALERSPAERYASAADLAREIERWMAGEAVRTNYVEPRSARLGRWARTRAGLLVLTVLSVIGVAALVALAGALYFITFRGLP